MAIKESLMFISVEEFKYWKGFDKLLFDNVTNSDENIWFAISVASSNIDYFSGFAISKKWPEQPITSFTDNVQTATAYYVRFLCTKGVDYTRGQASMAQGGIVYSETNPEDPYFIPPEVFNCLRNIKEYTAFQGFNLNVKPKTNFFSKFLSNKGEINPLENYIEILNLISSDSRVKIKLLHPINLQGTVVDVDTSGIKTDIDNLLWEINIDNPNFIKPKDDKGIDVNGKRIINVGTPTFLSDATTKEYVDKKQDKLIAGENIKIDEKTNTISATGGSGESLWEYDPNSLNILQPKIKGGGKPLITSNNTRIVDIADPIQPQDGVNLRTLDKKLEDVKSQFPIAFQINAVSQEIPNLETTNKSVAGAINELNKKQLIPIISNWKEVGTKQDNKTINYNFIKNKRYRIYYNYSLTDDKTEESWICNEFIYVNI